MTEFAVGAVRPFSEYEQNTYNLDTLSMLYVINLDCGV